MVPGSSPPPPPPPSYQAQLNRAAALLRAATRVVVFTGAGMSADSGIGTFRKSGNAMWSGVTGALTLGYFGTPLGWRLTPGLAWSKYLDYFLGPILTAQPHAGHHALARLESERFKPLPIITMNVDGFHQRAGNQEVAELHGTVRRNRCNEHGVFHFLEDKEGEPAPPLAELKALRCPTCAKPPRPDFVLFTEGLPSSEWMKAERALQTLVPERGDAVLVIGTTGEVYPAASIPERCIRRGLRTIEVNLHPSPISGAVDVYIEGRAAEVLPRLVEMVLSGGEGDGEGGRRAGATTTTADTKKEL